MVMNNQQQQQYSGPAWSIIDVTDVSIFDRELGVLPAKRVRFKLYTGKKSYVDIPLDDFTPESVNSRVDDAASAMFDVMALEGPQVNIYPVPPIQT